MLMLVVTIIIAAVVAGFSGGMVGTNSQKPPNLIMDVKIINSGIWYSSGFYASIIEVSRPIPTKDLTIVTSWTISNRTTGERETGGNTVMPNINNINHHICNSVQWAMTPIVSPFGSSFNNGQVDQKFWFGQYTLTPGTTLSAPTQRGTCKYYWDSAVDPQGIYSHLGVYGYVQQYQYPDPTYIDPAVAVLGKGWNDLRGGDTVNVKVIHIPTNKVIFNKNVLVTEG
jgi:FlaG/FlaF family flagellin (archaellin)